MDRIEIAVEEQIRRYRFLLNQSSTHSLSRFSYTTAYAYKCRYTQTIHLQLGRIWQTNQSEL